MRQAASVDSNGVPPRRRRRAVTLVEVLVSTVLVSTVLLISITASANLLRNQSQRFVATESVAVLSRLLDEVSSAEFRDPEGGTSFGPEPDETADDRTDFDDVDDYHGYSISPPTYRDGSTAEGFETWSAEISVARAEPSGTGIERVTRDDAPLREITVTLTAPDGTTRQQSVWVADVPVDTPPDASYERLRHIELTFSQQRKVTVAVPLRNRPDPAAE